jgi:hypothetical protein
MKYSIVLHLNFKYEPCLNLFMYKYPDYVRYLLSDEITPVL